MIAEHNKSIRPYSAVLLDVEGTTTDINFVKECLFPYARVHVASFLEEALTQQIPERLKLIDQLLYQSEKDEQTLHSAIDPDQLEPALAAGDFVPIDPSNLLSSLLTNIEWQMRHDRKSGALKALQGAIWVWGYRSRAIVGHVYPDVVPMLTLWQRYRIPVAIYSSGSIQAQKLLFGHSVFGDLCPYLAAHFDTTTGPKQDPKSYQQIAQQLKAFEGVVGPDSIVFLSDRIEELQAAQIAGMQAIQVVRADLDSSSEFIQLKDFIPLTLPSLMSAQVANKV